MKKFNPTNEMIEAAKTVFMTMAYTETIKPIIAKEWTAKGMQDQIILNPDQTYLLQDSDFQVYLQETFKARDKAGLRVDNPEFCPLLVAEDLQRQAERALIEAMEPVTHLEPARLYGDNRKKFLDLTLKLLAPFVGNAKEILTP
jgi:hypothetical protein